MTTVKTAKLHATEDGGKFEKQRNAQRHNRRTYAAKIEELETKWTEKTEDKRTTYPGGTATQN